MPDHPHVLLITTDHWPASLLGVAGHPAIQTPTLDQLARNGVRYPNAYSECPVCIPARRTLMTGTAPRTHGDRVFKVQEPMPRLPTLAQTFRDAGYQAYAVGKLHVFPQRDRIGFDDVILAEEGRPILGAIDDYDIWLGEQGYPGQTYAHGMSNNQYSYRPWHLPEQTHVTNWTTQQMCRMIRRRDPTRPGFWYLSYCHPHPPLVPLQWYLDLYRDITPPLPYVGEWAEDVEELPYALQAIVGKWGPLNPDQIRGVRRAFYALCTHIDHQLRLVIGTLREEQILDNTVILFTSDHGDMLGHHGLWAKRLFYENAANVPMILIGRAGDERVGHHRVDDDLAQCPGAVTGSVRAAVHAVGSYGTVTVCEGEYEEQQDVIVSRQGVTIAGAGVDLVTIRGHRFSNFIVRAPGVTISDLSLVHDSFVTG